MDEERDASQARALLGARTMLDASLERQTASPSRPSTRGRESKSPTRGRFVRFALAGAATLLLAVPALGSDGTEFACEEAVAHLADCCPSFDPHGIDCTYDPFDCDSGTDPNPELSRPQSECIQSMSCDLIQSEHVCERLAQGELPSCGT